MKSDPHRYHDFDIFKSFYQEILKWILKFDKMKLPGTKASQIREFYNKTTWKMKMDFINSRNFHFAYQYHGKAVFWKFK